MSIQNAPPIQSTVSKPAAGFSLSNIRAQLEEQRHFRLEQIQQLNCDMADGVRSGDDARQQVTRILAVSARAALDEIHAALGRLDTGAYGSCEGCGEPIALERLEVLPTSRLCTPCQYRLESARPGANARREMER